MTKVRGASFGVRFYRRGKIRNAESLKSDVKDGVQDNAYTSLPTPSYESAEIMIDVLFPAPKPELHLSQEHTAPAAPMSAPKNELRRFMVHPLQELTAPADVMATQGPRTAQEHAQVQRKQVAHTPAPVNLPASEIRPAWKEEKARERQDDRNIALWMAARSGDCYAIRLLVMDGVDLDARDPQGRTAINIATQYNQNGALKTLLAAKEMRRMSKLGELPHSVFFDKFKKSKTVNE